MEFNFDFGKALSRIIEKLEGWLTNLILILPNFILALFVFIAFIIIAKYIGKFIGRLIRNKVHQDSVRIITVKVVRAVIILIGFFIALGLLNLDKVLTTILAGAGVAGLAIGLALQGTLHNTFSGVILSFMPSLQIGDWVETIGFAGSVVEINLRNIVIKQSDNNLVFIPNSKLVDSPFKNYSITNRSRVMLDCGVSYEDDLEQVEQLTKETIAEIFQQKNEEEVEFMFYEFGDSSINFTVRFWTDVTKKRDILLAKNKAVIAIKKAFDKEGINIPFPIRTIDFTNPLNLDNNEEKKDQA
ncbi:MAG TPA: mechanosensitive ion channel family protein [Flavobacteriaceae bacterium]|nr:mechanosensitive ion channel family protein [Flavobacteriaceae bacterium]